MAGRADENLKQLFTDSHKIMSLKRISSQASRKLSSIARFVVARVVQCRQMTERPLSIEEFGPRVTSAWNGLRSATRHLLESAWRSSSEAGAGERRPAPYDHRADMELTQLLSALDERAGKPAGADENSPARQAQRLGDACAKMLAEQTQSAEVFAQLIQRAHGRQDFARLDNLANAMAQRL